MPKNSQKRENPISAAISSWLDTLPPALLELVVGSAACDVGAELIISKAPKRWVVYEPMVLLPSGSFTSAPWPALLQVLSPEQTQNIWEGILRGISSSYSSSSSSPSPRGGSSAKKASSSLTHLTHLAVNEGIPLRVVTHDENDGNGRKEEEGKEAGKENLLRSPSGLRLVYGDFGPSSSSLTEDDFAAAFWVSTKQNGIVQTWAPRWTMFSRGNVKEKARVLSFPSSSSFSHHQTHSLSSPSSKPSKSHHHHHHHHHHQSGVRTPSLPFVEHDEGIADRNTNTNTNLTTKKKPPPKLGNGSNNINKNKTGYAIDLYAGIGYFVFSYARLGFRVLCWELNPWSVEGLRRGAEANGWSVRIAVSPLSNNHGEDDNNNNNNNITKNILEGKWGEQIIVFLENNAAAAGRVLDLCAATTTTTATTTTVTTTSTTTTATTTTTAGDASATTTTTITGSDGDESDNNGSQQIDIKHINCGFLPSSEPSWRSAWEMLVGRFRFRSLSRYELAGDGGGDIDVDGDGESNSKENGNGKGKQCSTGGWLHLHENVGAADIERRRCEIQALMDEWGAAEDGVGVGAEVEHVELVKTFAPGVWHCVFDVYLWCTSRGRAS